MCQIAGNTEQNQRIGLRRRALDAPSCMLELSLLNRRTRALVARKRRRIDADDEVGAFPASRARPIKSESNRCSLGKRLAKGPRRESLGRHRAL